MIRENMNSEDISREKWLMRAATAMRAWFETEGFELPDVHVSVGFTGSACQLDRVLGACWQAQYSKDGKNHIFISPVVDDVPWGPHGVLGVLLHELCHAASGKPGHGKDFSSIAKRMGLCPPWRVTPSMTQERQLEVEMLATRLGQWNHAPLDVKSVPKRKRTAVLLAGTAIGKEARIIVPSETKDGRPLADHVVFDILQEVAKLFGGFTAWAGMGGYVMADGEVKQEKVTIVDMAVKNDKSTREQLEAIATGLKVAGEQETVYLRLPDGKVELI